MDLEASCSIRMATYQSALELLDNSSLLHVLSFLPPRDICSCQRLNRYFRDFCNRYEQEIWFSCQCRYFGIERRESVSVLGRRFGVRGGRDLCMRFHQICDEYGSVGYRMIRAWCRIYESVERWAKPVAETLVVPLTAEEVERCSETFDMIFKRPFPMELKCLYRVCGGQRHGDCTEEEEEEDSDGVFESDREDGAFQGIFPGMKVYHDQYSLSMLPLTEAVRHTLHSRGRNLDGVLRKFVLAEDLCGSGCMEIIFDYDSGQIQFDSKPRMLLGIDGVGRNRRIIAPDGPRPAWYVSGEDQMRQIEVNYPHYEDIVSSMGYAVHPVVPLVHWLECYARELEMQHIQYHHVQEVGARMLWRFPLKGPECRECVTRGIVIKSSCVLAPHVIHYPATALVWAYSIQMRLLRVEEQREQGIESWDTLDAVRLKGRCWKIISANGVQEVQGEGVVGNYPVLRQGGCTFEYQSYVSVNTAEHYTNKDVPVDGRMEGYFTFARLSTRDESLHAAAEAPIRAICPTMHLTLPDIII